MGSTSLAQVPTTYLSQCPSLSTDQAQLAEDSEQRPLMRDERLALERAVYTCALEIRMRRPPLLRAQLEGRLPAAG